MCSEESGRGYVPFKQGSGLRDWKMCDFQLRAEERASWTRLRQMTFSYRGAQTIHTEDGDFRGSSPRSQERDGCMLCFCWALLCFVLL